MAKVGGKLADAFVQKAYVDLTNTCGAAPANVCSVQFTSTHSATDRKGLIIHKVNYQIGESDPGLGDKERFHYGLSFVEAQSDWQQDNKTGILDSNLHHYFEIGAIAAGLTSRVQVNKEKEFTNLPGGGILVHPSSLWFFIQGENGVAGNNVVWTATIFFTMVDLSEDMYRELWELRLLASGI